MGMPVVMDTFVVHYHTLHDSYLQQIPRASLGATVMDSCNSNSLEFLCCNTPESSSLVRDLNVVQTQKSPTGTFDTFSAGGSESSSEHYRFLR